MNELMLINDLPIKEFNKNKIHVFIWNNKPCWIANEITRAFGYFNSKSVITRCIEAEEFEQGVEYDILKYSELKNFKKALNDTILDLEAIGKNASSLVVFYEDGLYGFLQYTNKPIGVQFRKWLRRDVIPQLRQQQLNQISQANQILLEDKKLLEQQIEQKEQQIEQKEQQIEQKEQQIEQKEQQIEELIISKEQLFVSSDVPYNVAKVEVSRFVRDCTYETTDIDRLVDGKELYRVYLAVINDKRESAIVCNRLVFEQVLFDMGYHKYCDTGKWDYLAIDYERAEEIANKRCSTVKSKKKIRSSK